MNEIMPDPLAFFLTWTTYGTWLPGDERGWVRERKGFQSPDPVRTATAQRLMTEPACTLNDEQRALVEATIAEHCRIRRWDLMTVNARTNHVHVVVAALENPDKMMDQFKAWCTRRLKEHAVRYGNSPRENWWTEGGSRRFINDEAGLEAAITYVRDGQ